MFIKKKSCCDIKLSSSFKPDIEVGLNDEEVNYYKNLKLINKRKKFKGKSHFRIIFESFFTFFNLILYILVIIFALFQNLYPNGEKAITITKYGFLIVIFFNALSKFIEFLLLHNMFLTPVYLSKLSNCAVACVINFSVSSLFGADV